MALATVDADGLPNVRMVLLKGFDAGASCSTPTPNRTRAGNCWRQPKAALVLHWKSLRRQVGLRGPVTLVSDAEADAYFQSRPRQPDRRMGEPAVPAAGEPLRAREGGRAARGPLSRSARCRDRPIGRASASPRSRSSSGRTGRFAFTIVSSSSAASGARRRRCILNTSGRDPVAASRITDPSDRHTPIPQPPRRIMLLTGASRGIGHATVKRFSRPAGG